MVQIDHKGALYTYETQAGQTIQTTRSNLNPPTYNINTEVHTQMRGSNLVDQGGEFEDSTQLTTTIATDGGARGWWRARNTICKLEAKRQRTSEVPGPTCEHKCTSTQHVHSAASVASTYICYVHVKTSQQAAAARVPYFSAWCKLITKGHCTLMKHKRVKPYRPPDQI